MFDSGPVHLTFWDRLFSKYFAFALSVSFHQCSTLILILILLSEGQEGKVLACSKKVMLLGITGGLDKKESVAVVQNCIMFTMQ
jgi:hypothetical protein